MVKQALPELVKLQPTWVYPEASYSHRQVHVEFIRALEGLVAAPSEDRFQTVMLQDAHAAPSPVLVEDDREGVGIRCACGKKGVLGRCAQCGRLMHYSRNAPELPGRPQPCPRCSKEAA